MDFKKLILDFAAEHPVLTILVLLIISDLVVEIVQAIMHYRKEADED